MLAVLKQERLGAKVLFRELDENKDGTLSEQEWVAWIEGIAKESEDDAISRLEWLESKIETAETPSPKAVKSSGLVRIHEDDHRSDELRSRAIDAFNKIDAQCSQDGSISREELITVLRQERLGAKVLFKELDDNTDGGISLAEWLAWVTKLTIKGFDEAESRLEWIEDRLTATALLGTPETEPLNTGRAKINDDAVKIAAFKKRTARAFDAIDAQCSRDGEVSREELLSVLKQERLGAKILFKELDENADGGISLTEWHHFFDSITLKSGFDEAESRIEWIEDRLAAASQTATPEQAPLDAHGIIHEKELRYAAMKDKAKQLFDAIDAECSQDGEVSREELLSVLSQERLGAKVLFRELDQNDDGGISLAEWHKWFDTLAGKGGIDEAESRLEWIEERLSMAQKSLTTLDEVEAAETRGRNDTEMDEASSRIHIEEATNSVVMCGEGVMSIFLSRKSVKQAKTERMRKIQQYRDAVFPCSTQQAECGSDSTIPEAKRLGHVLLRKIGRIDDLGDIIPGVPRVALKQPLWEMSGEQREVVISSDIVNEEGGGEGPMAEEIYGKGVFSISYAELSDLESTVRVASESVPRVFYAMLVGRFTANPQHCAYFALRRKTPLCDIGTEASEAALKVQLQAEQSLAMDSNSNVGKQFKEWVTDVTAGYKEYGFASSEEGRRVLGKSLEELAVGVCVSQKAYFMVDSVEGKRNQISKKPLRPVAFLSTALGHLSSDCEKRVMKAAVSSIFMSAHLQGCSSMVVPPLFADSPDLALLCYKTQFELLSERDWGFKCYFINATHYEDTLQCLAQGLTPGCAYYKPLEGKYLRCDVVFHDRDSKDVAVELSKKGSSVGMLNLCDSRSIMQGVFWEHGKRAGNTEETDYATTSTLILTNDLGSRLGAAALWESPVTRDADTIMVRIPLKENVPLGIHYNRQGLHVKLISVEPGSLAQHAGATTGVIKEASGCMIFSQEDLVRITLQLRKCGAGYIELKVVPDQTVAEEMRRVTAPLEALKAGLEAKLLGSPVPLEKPSRLMSPSPQRGRSQNAPSLSSPSPARIATAVPVSVPVPVPVPVGRGFGSSSPRRYHAAREVTPGPGAYINTSPSNPSPTGLQKQSPARPSFPRHHQVRNSYSPSRTISPSPVFNASKFPERRHPGTFSRNAEPRIGRVEKMGPGPGEYSPKRWLE
eukprot:TRINITY_DN3457_c0_g1_i1.p1 TRINITY_DN3457_c0_g1~~TRINITY_DN3457_c0_g1_i1.p1  ORF type:complete len:1224 (+),score=307.15 TRINITY_DN3457_c0_g1_i1:135-3674(+)